MPNENRSDSRSPGDTQRGSDPAQKTGQQSQGGSQQDNGDMKQKEPGQQPEIPKVGSRDAPGG